MVKRIGKSVTKRRGGLESPYLLLWKDPAKMDTVTMSLIQMFTLVS